jgi:hypothetical protein
MSKQNIDDDLSSIFENNDDDNSMINLMVETPDFTLIKKKEGEYDEGLMGNALLHICDTCNDLKHTILSTIKASMF